MTDFWDRKLLETQKELKAIQSGFKRAKGDRKEMARQLKKTKRYFRSAIAEVARLDNTLYNITKPTQTVQDEHKRTEAEGDNPSIGESAQT